MEGTQISDIYEEMFIKLVTEIADLDGTIEDFSPEDRIINVSVSPEFKEYAEAFINDLVLEYNNKIAKLLIDDPFSGVKRLLEEKAIN